MGLPLALLPTLLAVYRDIRDTHKNLCVQGHCVSWSTLQYSIVRTQVETAVAEEEEEVGIEPWQRAPDPWALD